MKLLKEKILLITFILFSLFYSESYGQARFSVSSGPWNSVLTWNGGVALPGPSETVTISVGDSVWLTSTTPTIGDLTISTNGVLYITNLAGSDLTTDGNITIGQDAKIYNNGGLDLVQSRNFTLLAGATYLHNPRNGTPGDENIFVFGIENFAPTSNLIIQKWFDESTPLGSPTRVSPSNANPNFGNVTLSFPSVTSWEQHGYFSPNRIKGSFNVTTGTISMDDGIIAPTMNLTLQDVNITGTGNIIFQSGLSRPYNLTTGNFTDNSTSASSTNIMYQSYGTLTWIVNGNLTLNHNFVGIEGTLSEIATANLTVNGNFTIGGGSFEFCKQVSASLTANITGTTTISGTPSKVRFVDGNAGNLTINTGNLVISGGNDNIFMGGNLLIPQATGTPTVNVTTDFTITGNSTTTILEADVNIRKTRVAVGRDFISSASGANLKIANSNGPVTFRTGRHLSMNGGNFIGQYSNFNISVDSVITVNDFNFNSATASNYFRANYGSGNTFITIGANFHMYASGVTTDQGFCAIYIPVGWNMGTGNLLFTVGNQYIQDDGRVIGIYRGVGNLTFTSTGAAFDMNGGDFRGIVNQDTVSAGTATFSLQSMDFDGGTWMAHYGCNSVSATVGVTFTGNCDINYTAATDQFLIIGLPRVFPINNSLLLNLTISGSLIISGASGTFISSTAQGAETINITGNFNVSGGNNSFNFIQNSGYPNGHNVTFTLSGDINISGGNSFLSAELGTLTANVTGDLNISGGTFSVKGNYGSATLNILTNFDQTAGTFFLHNNTLSYNPLIITVNMNSDGDANGNFTHTGGTIQYDNNTNVNSAEHLIAIRNPNYTIGGTGIITNASPGTGTRYGILTFFRVGVVNFNRSGTHNISQVKQIVENGCTLDVLLGNLQIMSHNTAAVDFLSVKFGGIVYLRNNSQIYSNATYANSGIQLNFNGRIRLQHTNGFYNNSTNAALSNAGNMNYSLSSASIIEYNGVSSQMLTGIGVGNALLPQHKYGILEINFQGTPDVEYVYPTSVPTTTSSIFVRFQLLLTNGELNLDTDHTPSNGGGSTVTVESMSATAIQRTNGYIRSETENGTGILKWNINSATGAHIFPFGYNSSNYIPFTYNAPSGISGEVSTATYHTNTLNTPYPPTVLHLNDLSGNDNSAETVDRFWSLNVTGAVPSVDLTFTVISSGPFNEMVGIVNPRAQKWVVPGAAWTFPLPGVQNSLVNGTQANSINNKSGWWTLASLASPLPVQLLDFNASCNNGTQQLRWITASEKDNDYFTVERSRDGFDYIPFIKVKGAGTTTQSTEYSVLDENPFPGNSFYRLKQTDFNGVTETFNVISAKPCKTIDGLQLLVAIKDNSSTSLLINAPQNDMLSITLFDVSGRQILTKLNTKILTGFNEVKLNTSSLSAGVYMVVLQSNTERITRKFILNR